MESVSLMFIFGCTARVIHLNLNEETQISFELNLKELRLGFQGKDGGER